MTPDHQLENYSPSQLSPTEQRSLGAERDRATRGGYIYQYHSKFEGDLTAPLSIDVTSLTKHRTGITDDIISEHQHYTERVREEVAEEADGDERKLSVRERIKKYEQLAHDEHPSDAMQISKRKSIASSGSGTPKQRLSLGEISPSSVARDKVFDRFDDQASSPRQEIYQESYQETRESFIKSKRLPLHEIPDSSEIGMSSEVLSPETARTREIEAEGRNEFAQIQQPRKPTDFVESVQQKTSPDAGQPSSVTEISPTPSDEAYHEEYVEEVQTKTFILETKRREYKGLLTSVISEPVALILEKQKSELNEKPLSEYPKREAQMFEEIYVEEKSPAGEPEMFEEVHVEPKSPPSTPVIESREHESFNANQLLHRLSTQLDESPTNQEEYEETEQTFVMSGRLPIQESEKQHLQQVAQISHKDHAVETDEEVPLPVIPTHIQQNIDYASKLTAEHYPSSSNEHIEDDIVETKEPYQSYEEAYHETFETRTKVIEYHYRKVGDILGDTENESYMFDQKIDRSESPINTETAYEDQPVENQYFPEHHETLESPAQKMFEPQLSPVTLNFENPQLDHYEFPEPKVTTFVEKELHAGEELYEEIYEIKTLPTKIPEQFNETELEEFKISPKEESALHAKSLYFERDNLDHFDILIKTQQLDTELVYNEEISKVKIEFENLYEESPTHPRTEFPMGESETFEEVSVDEKFTKQPSPEMYEEIYTEEKLLKKQPEMLQEIYIKEQSPTQTEPEMFEEVYVVEKSSIGQPTSFDEHSKPSPDLEDNNEKLYTEIEPDQRHPEHLEEVYIEIKSPKDYTDIADELRVEQKLPLEHSEMMEEIYIEEKVPQKEPSRVEEIEALDTRGEAETFEEIHVEYKSPLSPEEAHELDILHFEQYRLEALPLNFLPDGLDEMQILPSIYEQNANLGDFEKHTVHYQQEEPGHTLDIEQDLTNGEEEKQGFTPLQMVAGGIALGISSLFKKKSDDHDESVPFEIPSKIEETNIVEAVSMELSDINVDKRELPVSQISVEKNEQEIETVPQKVIQDFVETVEDISSEKTPYCDTLFRIDDGLDIFQVEIPRPDQYELMEDQTEVPEKIDELFKKVTVPVKYSQVTEEETEPVDISTYFVKELHYTKDGLDQFVIEQLNSYGTNEDALKDTIIHALIRTNDGLSTDLKRYDFDLTTKKDETVDYYTPETEHGKEFIGETFPVEEKYEAISEESESFVTEISESSYFQTPQSDQPFPVSDKELLSEPFEETESPNLADYTLTEEIVVEEKQEKIPVQEDYVLYSENVPGSTDVSIVFTLQQTETGLNDFEILPECITEYEIEEAETVTPPHISPYMPVEYTSTTEETTPATPEQAYLVEHDQFELLPEQELDVITLVYSASGLNEIDTNFTSHLTLQSTDVVKDKFDNHITGVENVEEVYDSAVHKEKSIPEHKELDTQNNMFIADAEQENRGLNPLQMVAGGIALGISSLFKKKSDQSDVEIVSETFSQEIATGKKFEEVSITEETLYSQTEPQSFETYQTPDNEPRGDKEHSEMTEKLKHSPEMIEEIYIEQESSTVKPEIDEETYIEVQSLKKQSEVIEEVYLEGNQEQPEVHEVYIETRPLEEQDYFEKMTDEEGSRERPPEYMEEIYVENESSFVEQPEVTEKIDFRKTSPEKQPELIEEADLDETVQPEMSEQTYVETKYLNEEDQVPEQQLIFLPDGLDTFFPSVQQYTEDIYVPEDKISTVSRLISETESEHEIPTKKQYIEEIYFQQNPIQDQTFIASDKMEFEMEEPLYKNEYEIIKTADYSAEYIPETTADTISIHSLEKTLPGHKEQTPSTMSLKDFVVDESLDSADDQLQIEQQKHLAQGSQIFDSTTESLVMQSSAMQEEDDKQRKYTPLEMMVGGIALGIGGIASIFGKKETVGFDEKSSEYEKEIQEEHFQTEQLDEFNFETSQKDTSIIKPEQEQVASADNELQSKPQSLLFAKDGLDKFDIDFGETVPRQMCIKEIEIEQPSLDQTFITPILENYTDISPKQDETVLSEIGLLDVQQSEIMCNLLSYSPDGLDLFECEPLFSASEINLANIPKPRDDTEIGIPEHHQFVIETIPQQLPEEVLITSESMYISSSSDKPSPTVELMSTDELQLDEAIKVRQQIEPDFYAQLMKKEDTVRDIITKEQIETVLLPSEVQLQYSPRSEQAIKENVEIMVDSAIDKSSEKLWQETSSLPKYNVDNLEMSDIKFETSTKSEVETKSYQLHALPISITESEQDIISQKLFTGSLKQIVAGLDEQIIQHKQDIIEVSEESIREPTNFINEQEHLFVAEEPLDAATLQSLTETPVSEKLEAPFETVDDAIKFKIGWTFEHEMSEEQPETHSLYYDYNSLIDQPVVVDVVIPDTALQEIPMGKEPALTHYIIRKDSHEHGLPISMLSSSADQDDKQEFIIRQLPTEELPLKEQSLYQNTIELADETIKRDNTALIEEAGHPESKLISESTGSEKLTEEASILVKEVIEQLENIGIEPCVDLHHSPQTDSQQIQSLRTTKHGLDYEDASGQHQQQKEQQDAESPTFAEKLVGGIASVFGKKSSGEILDAQEAYSVASHETVLSATPVSPKIENIDEKEPHECTEPECTIKIIQETPPKFLDGIPSHLKDEPDTVKFVTQASNIAPNQVLEGKHAHEDGECSEPECSMTVIQETPPKFLDGIPPHLKDEPGNITTDEMEEQKLEKLFHKTSPMVEQEFEEHDFIKPAESFDQDLYLASDKPPGIVPLDKSLPSSELEFELKTRVSELTDDVLNSALAAESLNSHVDIDNNIQIDEIEETCADDEQSIHEATVDTNAHYWETTVQDIKMPMEESRLFPAATILAVDEPGEASSDEESAGVEHSETKRVDVTELKQELSQSAQAQFLTEYDMPAGPVLSKQELLESPVQSDRLFTARAEEDESLDYLPAHEKQSPVSETCDELENILEVSESNKDVASPDECDMSPFQDQPEEIIPELQIQESLDIDIEGDYEGKSTEPQDTSLGVRSAIPRPWSPVPPRSDSEQAREFDVYIHSQSKSIDIASERQSPSVEKPTEHEFIQQADSDFYSVLPIKFLEKTVDNLNEQHFLTGNNVEGQGQKGKIHEQKSHLTAEQITSTATTYLNLQASTQPETGSKSGDMLSPKATAELENIESMMFMERQTSLESVNSVSIKSGDFGGEKIYRSSDSLDRASMKSAESAGAKQGKRYSTSRRSSTSSRHSSHDENPIFSERLTPELQIVWSPSVEKLHLDEASQSLVKKILPDSLSSSASSSKDSSPGDSQQSKQQSRKETSDIESPDVHIEFENSQLQLHLDQQPQLSPESNGEGAFPSDVSNDEPRIDIELETVPEEPELENDYQKIAGTFPDVNSKKTSRHGSSGNVSEASLQEFERLERELALRGGESSLSNSEVELLLAQRRRLSNGSQNSLAEFERLETECTAENGNAENKPVEPIKPEDVMVLSDIREESEPEDMSTRDDDECEDDVEDQNVDLNLTELTIGKRMSIPDVLPISSREMTPTGSEKKSSSTPSESSPVVEHVVLDMPLHEIKSIYSTESKVHNIPEFDFEESKNVKFVNNEMLEQSSDVNAQLQSSGSGVTKESMIVPVSYAQDLTSSADSLELQGALHVSSEAVDRDSLNDEEIVPNDDQLQVDRDSLQDFDISQSPLPAQVHPAEESSSVEIVVGSIIQKDSLENIPEYVEQSSSSKSHFLIQKMTTDIEEPVDKDSLLASSISGMSGDDMDTAASSQECHDAGLSGDTLHTYQEYEDEHDKDSLAGDLDEILQRGALAAYADPHTPIVETPHPKCDEEGNEDYSSSGYTFLQSSGEQLMETPYPYTFTTYETSQSRDDGSVEIITRTVSTKVTDPVLQTIRFTGPDLQEKLDEYVSHLQAEGHEFEEFETVDELGNVTKTVIRRVIQPHDESDDWQEEEPVFQHQLHQRPSSMARSDTMSSHTTEDTTTTSSQCIPTEYSSQLAFDEASRESYQISSGTATYPPLIHRPDQTVRRQSPTASKGSTDSLESTSYHPPT